MTKRPELFAERPVGSADTIRLEADYGRRRVVTVIVLCALIAGTAFWLFHHRAPRDPADIPTIKAEGSYRQKPDNPGGMDIPHQDVEVYKQLDGSSSGNTVEHLLPPAEMPAAQTTTTSSTPLASLPIGSSGPVSNDVAHFESLTLSSAEPLTTVSKSPAADLAKDEAVQSASDGATITAPVADAPVSTAPAPTAKAVPEPKTMPKPLSGGIAVQLAAVTDPAAAQVTLEKLQQKYQSVLSGAELRVVKADLGAKGVYYRIQSQPLDEVNATAICARLKQSNAGCMLVRP